MKKAGYILLLFAVFVAGQTLGQKKSRSIKLKKEFPLLIGNIGFAVDSTDFFVGDVKQGSTFTYNLGMYNYGEEEVIFTPGKSSKLITVDYSSKILPPRAEGSAIIKFEALHDLPLGPVQLEVAIQSNDKENPWKFLYLNANIVPGGVGAARVDTVPRMVFDHYNYEYGHKAVKGAVRHDFLFTNVGGKDLIIKKIELCPGCKMIGEPKKVIAPGESGSIVLKIWTKGFGVSHRSIKVYTNDPLNPVIFLGIHGTVTFKSPAKKNPDFCKDSY